jgi:hypothetical protein
MQRCRGPGTRRAPVDDPCRWRDPGRHRPTSGELSHGARGAGAVPELLRTGGGGSAIYGDLIDLFEQSAANRTPIRQIVGEDPVEFIETFVLNYPKGQWIIRERERLISAIERAAGETPEEKRGQSDSGTASPGDPCARSGEVVQDG